jgi:uncharacterized membrane protein YhaH (DUF805 family)
MDWKHLLLSFEGRISRQTFWIGFAVLFVAEIAAQSFAQRIDGERLGAIVDLAFTYPEFALFIKRANDRNTPIWVLGMFFAVGVLLNFLSIVGWAGLPDERTPQFMLILAVWAIFALALLVDLGFRAGVPGRNQFGPDPLDGSQ